jgi:signal transduction histidine kinase
MGILGLTLAVMFATVPGRAPWWIFLVITLALNAGTLLLALRRAAAPGAESIGWRYFSAGVAVSLVGHLIWLVHTPAHGQLWKTLVIGAIVLSGALMGLGIVRWPWRRAGWLPQGGTFLGSLVFCLSFLLIPWMNGLWDPFFRSVDPHRLLAMALGSRMVLVGGVVSFLVAEDPRRLKGALGWILLNCGLLFMQAICLSQVPLPLEGPPRSPWMGLMPLTTGALLMVPLGSTSAEDPLPGKALPSWVPGLLLHSPFLVATALLVAAILRGHPPGPAVLLLFLLMTGLLLFRQSLLQHQLTASHQTMEARVALRTQELERLQDVVLINERLNAVVVLGAGLVHDLNKGLGSILNAAEVLQMELERHMKVSGFAVEAIIQAVDRSAVLSSRVMDFSRMLQEEGEVRDLRWELAALEGILKLLVPGQVNLMLQPGLEPAPVRIHTEDLKQILVNLVANARDAMPDGGTIRVTVGKEVSTGEIYLDVEDTGVGIPDENRERMFEPFFTTKDPGQATGLGLASVRVLLEKARGRVEVRSTVGTGTRFRLLFPGTASVHA